MIAESTIKTPERYQIFEEIGRGGMAVVYRGKDTTLGREVAVKVLHAHLADRPDSRRRFEREAKAVARLNHRNILEIYDFSGSDSKDSYIITEFIDGITLRDFITEHPIRHPEIAEMLLLEVARAVSHAHGLSIIHRDIKPENVMVASDGTLKLMDFGIAQILNVQQLTVTGTLIGSPAHMAPEAIEGQPQDFRSDVFSLGTMLYCLACGQLPFTGDNPHAVMKKIVDSNYENPQKIQPLIGRSLKKILAKALQKAPDCRYQSVDEMIGDLESDIWSIQITDSTSEVKGFLTDPARYQQVFASRLAAIFLEKGKTSANRHEIPTALDFYNRLLTLDDGNLEAQAALDALTTRPERRWWLWGVLGLIAVLALIFGYRYLTDDASSLKSSLAPRAAMRVAAAPVAFPRRAPEFDVALKQPKEREVSGASRYMAEVNARVHRVSVLTPKRPIELEVPPEIKVLVPITIKALPLSASIRVAGLSGNGIIRSAKLAPGTYTVVLNVPLISWLRPTKVRLKISAGDGPRQLLYYVRCQPARIAIRGAVKSLHVKTPSGVRTSRSGSLTVPMGRWKVGMRTPPRIKATITAIFSDGIRRVWVATLVAGRTFTRTP